MSKGTNFQFGTHARRESPVMTPKKFFEKGALNANISKMAKDTNFKFGRHAPLNVRTEFLKKLVSKGGVAIVT